VNSTDSADAAKSRLRQAVHDRDATMAKAQQALWVVAANGLNSGELNLRDVAELLDLSEYEVRENLAKLNVGTVKSERLDHSAFIAVGMRISGEEKWRVTPTDDDGHPSQFVVTRFVTNETPYRYQDIELAYRLGSEFDAAALVNLADAKLSRRGGKLYLSEAVFDELFGPHVLSVKRRDWLFRAAELYSGTP
jgi:hypothetical protein